MADSPHVKINLIGKARVSVADNFLKWAVTVGRIVIVATELIALGALLYRFTIDRKIIDLHDQIRKAQIFVKAQSAKEKDYRSIQERLLNIKETEEDTKAKIEIMNDILGSIARGNFSSTNLTVAQQTISVNGIAFSIFPINNFLEKLKENPNVVSIALDEVSGSAQGVQFKLTIELKQRMKRI
ncbi:hypothetical protein A3A74_00515 [Candidatus Roizmanbacteria bacterium RIFCSPLOWO2_01_FULL_35_13]|uniref:Pilus assembly protein PilN n=1 Tax=Candidatus Roizmanbacteria bacterium RIFCSPLOWO2_01_FULL_35_13 TaxID=1802055 RepID=A0A1F7IBB5_9BACT|nr:MAG: hypothetical protein A3A74_00515 [Candidatus Roizmanbacteria bacterium RIFCSPLOWO2_01_FULL_35_13]